MSKARTPSARTAAAALLASAASPAAPVGGSDVTTGATGSDDAPSEPVAGPLDAATPSVPAVAASLTAPVLPEAGAVLGADITTKLPELLELTAEPEVLGIDLATDDLRALPVADSDAAFEAVLAEMVSGGGAVMVRSVPTTGRRRAGKAFGPVPVPVKLSEIGIDGLRGLLTDPLIIVQFDD